MTNQKITVGELSQELANQLLQLSAMLVMTHGEQGESFRNINDNLQDLFMWGLADKVNKIAQGAEALNSSLVGIKLEVRRD